MSLMKRPLWQQHLDSNSPQITVTQFRANCHAIMQAVHDGRIAEIVVTKHGTPLAKIVGCKPVEPSMFGFAKGKIVLFGNVFSTDERWNA